MNFGAPAAVRRVRRRWIGLWPESSYAISTATTWHKPLKSDVAYALVRAASRLVSTPAFYGFLAGSASDAGKFGRRRSIRHVTLPPCSLSVRVILNFACAR